MGCVRAANAVSEREIANAIPEGLSEYSGTRMGLKSVGTAYVEAENASHATG